MTEQDQQEIVRRLRSVDNLYSAPLCRAAAALIETLTRERDELRAAQMDVLNGAGAIVGNVTDSAYETIKALERERDEARLTLADINDALRIALNDDIEGMERERIERLAALSSLTPGGEG